MAKALKVQVSSMATAARRLYSMANRSASAFQTKFRREPVQDAPLLSVVVPVYNVEQYLEACLRSLLDQSLRDLEIIAVDDCSPDNSAEVVQRLMLEDRRIRLIQLPKNVGLSEARNAGVRAAQGQYLCFLDSDDTIAPEAYRTAVDTLEETQSDFAIFGYNRFNSSRKWKSAPWIQSLHAQTRLKTVIDDLPEMMVNAVAWSKVYRRTFWDRAALSFPPGVKYEDQPVSALAYSRAKSVDVIGRHFVNWRAREDRSSISQQIHTSEDLAERLNAATESLRICAEHDSGELRLQRLAQLLANDFPHSIAAVPRGDEGYFETLRTGLADFLSHSEPWMWDRMTPQSRVAYELLLRGDREELVEFYDRGGLNTKNFKTVVDGDSVLVELPFFDDPTLPIPRHRFALIERQLNLIPGVRRIWWSAEGDLKVQGWAYIDNMDTVENETRVEVELLHSATGKRVPVPTVMRVDPEISAISKHKWCNYEHAAFEATLPVTHPDLLGAGNGAQWEVVASVRVGPRTVSGPLGGITKWGSAGHLRARTITPNTRVVPRRRSDGSLELHYYKPFASVRTADVDGRHVSLTLDVDRPQHLKRLELRNRAFDVHVSAELSAGDGNTVRASAELPDLVGRRQRRTDVAAHQWIVRAVPASGKKSPVVWALPEGASAASDALVIPRETAAGNLSIEERRPVVFVNSARLEGRAIEVSVGATDIPDGGLALRAVGANTAVRADIESASETALVRLELEAAQWSGPVLPLPVGKYQLQAFVGDARIDLVPSTELVSQMPLVQNADLMNLRLDFGPGRELTLEVLRPLRVDERGSRQQRQLQDWHAEMPVVPATGTALFRSYYGENTGCNAGSVFAELRNSRPDIQVYWAISDYSVAVPEGGIPVVHESREWYELLRNAEFVMDNMHQPVYHKKAPHQKIIETFHGYPFKEMGHPHWEHLGFSQERIDSFDRRAAEWDYLVSPATYATPLLRRDFKYDGEVLEIGYPRNDVLLSAGAAARRAAVRESLGIAEGQTAVLYAPTFRDYLSQDDHSAPIVNFLDVRYMLNRLGDKYVLLMRGHAFNARSNSRINESHPNFIDVTSYPDVADLYLAADSAIADYSSLRFDFGVTGKPMIFFVPDLELYRARRNWLFDYEPTAPGPLVRTTEEVVDCLLDLPRLQADYAEAYLKFKTDFLNLEDGHASKRLVEAVFGITGEGPAGNQPKSAGEKIG